MAAADFLTAVEREGRKQGHKLDPLRQAEVNVLASLVARRDLRQGSLSDFVTWAWQQAPSGTGLGGAVSYLLYQQRFNVLVVRLQKTTHPHVYIIDKNRLCLWVEQQAEGGFKWYDPRPLTDLGRLPPVIVYCQPLAMPEVPDPADWQLAFFRRAESRWWQPTPATAQPPWVANHDLTLFTWQLWATVPEAFEPLVRPPFNPEATFLPWVVKEDHSLHDQIQRVLAEQILPLLEDEAMEKLVPLPALQTSGTFLLVYLQQLVAHLATRVKEGELNPTAVALVHALTLPYVRQHLSPSLWLLLAWMRHHRRWPRGLVPDSGPWLQLAEFLLQNDSECCRMQWEYPAAHSVLQQLEIQELPPYRRYRLKLGYMPNKHWDQLSVTQMDFFDRVLELAKSHQLLCPGLMTLYEQTYLIADTSPWDKYFWMEAVRQPMVLNVPHAPRIGPEEATILFTNSFMPNLPDFTLVDTSAEYHHHPLEPTEFARLVLTNNGL